MNRRAQRGGEGLGASLPENHVLSPKAQPGFFLPLLRATVKGSGTYLCREAPGTEVQFREGKTQAPEGNQLASQVDSAAPRDSTHWEPRGRDGKGLPGAPLFVLPGACPLGFEGQMGGD